MAIIELSGISFTYPLGTQALKGISLSIEKGDTVAIIGQNGAGKTTMIKMVNGLLRPTTGAVFLYGEDISGKTTALLSRKVGFVFQNPRTQLFLSSVVAEVAFGPKNLGFTGEHLERQVTHALEMTGLNDRREVHPYDLTPADRKLLTIASIISMDPTILILDEPTGGLDYHAAEKVAGVVDRYRAEGRTVITVTHDMDFVAICFQRVVVMSRRQIVTDGPVHEVFCDHALLAGTHLEPTAIGVLAAACGLPKSLITVPEMAAYLQNKRGL
jgi:energy-coupling factor transport system ATP-binding protein